MAGLPHGLRAAARSPRPGTLGGLEEHTLRLNELTRLLSGLAPVIHSLIERPLPSRQRRSFEQGDWMAELELLQLGQEIQALARESGGFEAELFDLMVSIADVLERDHDWNRSQSNQWLERLGLFDEDCSSEPAA